MKRAWRYLITLLLLAAGCSLTACASLTSPIDEAYYKGGDVFSIPGGYTRTIFSTSNF